MAAASAPEAASLFMPAVVAKAVNEVMGKVTGVEKNGRNEFHKYDFARVEDLLAKVHPAMVEAGLIIIQSEVEHALIADNALATATYSFKLVHVSGEGWTDEAYHTGMAAAKNHKGGFDDKSLNKCHTAARKYFLLALLQVPVGNMPDADDDADEAPRGNVTQHKQASGAADQPGVVSRLKVKIDSCLDGRDLENWKVDSSGALNALSDDNYNDVVRHYKAHAVKLEKEPAQ